MNVPIDTRAGCGIEAEGFRMPEGLRLGRVVLQVSDLQRSVDYYEKVVGLASLERSGGTAILGPSENGDVLVELRERPGARRVPVGGRIGLYHFAILLPDRESLGRFVAQLTEYRVRFGASDHRVSEAVYLTDPDGLGIEVYADRSRAEWEHRAGQLVMTTEPLDLRNVVSAAGGQKWRGMPAGTRMGHLHLHVGDLNEAERFYHGALGLDKVVWSYPGALFLSAGGYHHHLGVNTWAAASGVAAEDDARLLEWEMTLGSAAILHEAGESLRRHGFPAAAGADGAIQTADPWGTAVRLLAR